MTENLRLKSRSDYLERQLEEARSDLLIERNRIKSQIESAAKYANLMEKVENLNLLNESNRLLRDDKEKLEQQVKQQSAKVRNTIQEYCVNTYTVLLLQTKLNLSC